jgi:hypothetical protein
VGLSKKHNRWKALIKVHGKRKELGSFPTEEAAARCYDRHAVLAWGARCAACLVFRPTFLAVNRAPPWEEPAKVHRKHLELGSSKMKEGC